jgi:hypothetical protein
MTQSKTQVSGPQADAAPVANSKGRSLTVDEAKARVKAAATGRELSDAELDAVAGAGDPQKGPGTPQKTPGG